MSLQGDSSIVPSAGSPCRTALIGVTGYGTVHLRALLLAAGKGLAKPVAAVVINPDQARDACDQLLALGAELYNDYESLFRAQEGKLDLCMIPTGINWHAPMTLAALQAGANVLVEKPLCGSNEEAAAMIGAEKRSGCFIAVGFQDLYDPKVLQIKKILLSGKIGRIKRIRGWALWPRGASYYARNSWAGRLFVEEKTVLDSPFNNAMAHFLNLLLFFGGKSLEDMADITDLQAELFRTRAIESFDTGSLLARTSDGVELGFHGSHSCRTNIHPRIWIEGEKGAILWSQDSPLRFIYEGRESEWLPVTPGEEKVRNMMESVLSRRQNPGQWICTAEMASRHTSLINRLHRDFPVQDLPPSFYHIKPEDQDRIPVITGIEQHIAEASEKSLMLGNVLLS